ncbi:MAG: hypothetical protein GKS03_03280 [Alphaproteobacteria bacterium]|nr:hypothetical protein [Alphaproteobacteria bacterium]
MLQFDTQFNNDALEKLVADLEIHDVADLMVQPASAANENRVTAETPRPDKDKVAWEDDEYYFVRES